MKTIRPTERRRFAVPVEVRTDGGKIVIEGHAAVFNRSSQNLGGFVERVAPGAFTKTIQEADVRALFNHDENLILGRNTAGTLELDQDNVGLAYRVYPGKRSYELDLIESMERGEVTQSSFAFTVIEDEWGLDEREFPIRTLREVQLYDVSPVTYPAYLDADSGIASRAIERLAEKRGLDPHKSYDLRELIAGEVKKDPDTSATPEPDPSTPFERSGLEAALEARRLTDEELLSPSSR